MAYYENLPIYRKAMELAIYLEQVVRHFSRYHKYSIGAELRDLSRRIYSQVIRANSRRDKVAAGALGCRLGLARRGLGVQCGFPVSRLGRYKERARQSRLSYVVIGENGYLASGVKRRVVTEKVTFYGGMA